MLYCYASVQLLLLLHLNDSYLCSGFIPNFIRTLCFYTNKKSNGVRKYRNLFGRKNKEIFPITTTFESFCNLKIYVTGGKNILKHLL